MNKGNLWLCIFASGFCMIQLKTMTLNSTCDIPYVPASFMNYSFISNIDKEKAVDDKSILREVFSCYVLDEDGLSVSCRNVDIEQIAKYLPVETKRLEMRDSHYPVFRQPLFFHLQYLESLTLYNNSHRYVTSKAFIGLCNLKSLNMSGNVIRVLKRTFSYTPMLERLDLSENSIFNIKYVADAVYESRLAKLTELFLNNNGFIAQILSDGLKPLEITKLRKLYLYNTTIRRVDAEAFDHLKYLEFLDLSVNYMNEDALKNLTVSLRSLPLKTLFIRQLLGLYEFPAEALGFLQNTTIQRLDMGYNHLSTLPQFPRLPSLEDLGVSYCSVRVIEPSAFENLPNLTSLALDNNKISEVAKSISVMSNLEYLYLHDQDVSLTENQYMTIKPFNFVNMVNLLLLEISGVYTSGTLYRYNYYGLKKLKLLILQRTGTTMIDDYAFETLESLEALDLQGNSLSFVTSFTFYGLKNLKFLFMNNNRILLTAAYSYDPFHETPSLQILRLYGNRIEEIPEHLFAELHNLKELFIFDNNLVPWNSSILSPNTNIKSLHLGKNQITYVTHAMMEDFAKVTDSVDLTDNPFDCDICELLVFQQFMQNSSLNFKIHLKSILDGDYLCENPKLMRGRSLVNINFSERLCTENAEGDILASVLIVLICSLVVMAIIIWVCYSFRWYIRYGVFHVSAELKERQSSAIDNSRYCYDAFVSYNSADTQWVITHLIPTLEEQQPVLKLCIHERDFRVGHLITENILEAIEMSRKVILVLSEEFIKSEWCKFELHMAQHKLFDDKRNSLILIKLKNINKRLYTKNLLYLEKTRTCFCWTDDPVGQNLFWSKLRRTISNRINQ